MYAAVFSSKAQDSCAPAAGGCIWHIMDGALCVGAPWTGLSFHRGCLEKSSGPPCQCHHVFIPGKPHCGTSRMCSHHISEWRSAAAMASLFPSALSCLSICFWLSSVPTGGPRTHISARTQEQTRCCVCAFLIKSVAFCGVVVPTRVTFPLM